MKNRNGTALGFILACAVAMTGIGGSAAIAVDALPAPASSKVQPQPSKIPYLPESELKDIGLTRSDAEQATDSLVGVASIARIPRALCDTMICKSKNIIGYAHVSAEKQDLTTQGDALAALGIDSEHI